MMRSFLAALLALVLLSCADHRLTILDQELDLYRYEHEKHRGVELAERYRLERERCDELTEKILAVRVEIEKKSRDLATLRARLREVEAALAEGRKEAERLAEAGKPAEAPEKPAGEKPAGEKPPVKEQPPSGK